MSKLDITILCCLASAVREGGPIAASAITARTLSVIAESLLATPDCTCTSESGVYKHLRDLLYYDYIDEGFKDGKYTTYYITEKGLELVHSTLGSEGGL